MGLKYDLQTAAKLIQSCVRKFLVRTTFLNGIAAYQLLAMGIELSFKDDYQYTVDRFGRDKVGDVFLFAQPKIPSRPLPQRKEDSSSYQAAAVTKEDLPAIKDALPAHCPVPYDLLLKESAWLEEAIIQRVTLLKENGPL